MPGTAGLRGINVISKSCVGVVADTQKFWLRGLFWEGKLTVRLDGETVKVDGFWKIGVMVCVPGPTLMVKLPEALEIIVPDSVPFVIANC